MIFVRRFDPGGISTFTTKEIWGYGAEGHLSFPTLGCVFIDTAGQAQYIFGGRGHPPARALFEEEELRGLLRVIDTTPGYKDGYYYNPLSLIKVVNALQALGKQRAMAAIDEYLRVSSEFTSEYGRDGVFLVLRVLFDIPGSTGTMPPMFVREPGPLRTYEPEFTPAFSNFHRARHSSAAGTWIHGSVAEFVGGFRDISGFPEASS